MHSIKCSTFYLSQHTKSVPLLFLKALDKKDRSKRVVVCQIVQCKAGLEILSGCHDLTLDSGNKPEALNTKPVPRKKMYAYGCLNTCSGPEVSSPTELSMSLKVEIR